MHISELHERLVGQRASALLFGTLVLGTISELFDDGKNVKGLCIKLDEPFERNMSTITNSYHLSTYDGLSGSLKNVRLL